MHFSRFSGLKHNITPGAGAPADEMVVQAANGKQGWDWSFRFTDTTVRQDENVLTISNKLVSLRTNVIHGFLKARSTSCRIK
jgi:hypothetical protein